MTKLVPIRAAVASFLAAALCFQASPIEASIVTFTGDTTGKPTFNRPLEDLSALSVVGTAVPYDTLTFTVSVTGLYYTFLTTGAFDTFILLYNDPFNPASPLTNALKANDDLMTLTTSGFVNSLTAGSTYVLVTTGFSNADFGEHSTTIGGPGDVTVVPEPGTSGLLALGLAGMALRRRRDTGARPSRAHETKHARRSHNAAIAPIA